MLPEVINKDGAEREREKPVSRGEGTSKGAYVPRQDRKRVKMKGGVGSAAPGSKRNKSAERKGR